MMIFHYPSIMTKLNPNVWEGVDLSQFQIKTSKTKEYSYIAITKLGTKKQPQNTMVSELLLIANEGVAP